MTPIDIKKIAEDISLDSGRVWEVEARASGLFVTGYDRRFDGNEYRADAILHANQLTNPEDARAALVDALRTISHMLDISVAAGGQ